jgi:hypothetical protein
MHRFPCQEIISEQKSSTTEIIQQEIMPQEGTVNLIWMAHDRQSSMPAAEVQQPHVTSCQTANERVLSARWWAALNK